MKSLDDKAVYQSVMQFPYQFLVYAQTENLEQYDMEICAKNLDQAEQAAALLCDFLGLKLQNVHEKD